MMELNNIQKVHMLGIGGIGMSALARFLHRRGKTVTGYDKTATPLTAELEAEGIAVHYHADPSFVAAADLVIYTPAVPKDQAEFVAAKESGVAMMKRAELLGMISRTYKTIAVAGTHGKTSTTGLITHVLRSCGFDVTGFVGGITNNYKSNYIAGDSDWMVVEADEFDRSFLQLSPDIAVITSMDADHLDIYGDADQVRESYLEFAQRVKDGGTLFIQHSLPEVEYDNNRKAFTYGVGGGICRSDNLTHRGLGVYFDYHSLMGSYRGLQLNLPGRYNVENATAAVSVAMALGASQDDIRKGLESFTGIKRRFDIRYRSEQVVYIDDYAHHPTEISSMLEAVRSMLPGYKLIVAFQPHLYTRTRDFHTGFAESLSMADAVVLLDIYPARELPIEGVSSQMVFDLIDADEKRMCSLGQMVDTLKTFKTHPAVVVTLGAGDIDTQVDAVRSLVSTW
jgi:UDP-N-acetylmuramate--alanine ligase